MTVTIYLLNLRCIYRFHKSLWFGNLSSARDMLRFDINFLFVFSGREPVIKSTSNWVSQNRVWRNHTGWNLENCYSLYVWQVVFYFVVSKQYKLKSVISKWSGPMRHLVTEAHNSVIFALVMKLSLSSETFVSIPQLSDISKQILWTASRKNDFLNCDWIVVFFVKTYCLIMVITAMQDVFSENFV